MSNTINTAAHINIHHVSKLKTLIDEIKELGTNINAKAIEDAAKIGTKYFLTFDSANIVKITKTRIPVHQIAGLPIVKIFEAIPGFKSLPK